MKTSRIAMWSGPRNISTALMRSFENRPDTFVSDEPFYAYFLVQTGYQHPGWEEIIKSQNSNKSQIIKYLINETHKNKSVWYQKHMTHHLLDEDDYSWIKKIKNCFLIRHPKDVIHSYTKQFELFNSNQLGYAQQKKIYDWLCSETDYEPPIIESKELTKNPHNILKNLCETLKIKYYKSMLSWDKGSRKTDGIWGKYWYKNVENSTCFKKILDKEKDIQEEFKAIYFECLEIYNYFLDKKDKIK